MSTGTAGPPGGGAPPTPVRKYSPWHSPAFYLALLIVTATVIAAVGLGQGWWAFNQMLGPLPLHHWMSITGAAFIAVYTPVYAVIKRRQPDKIRRLLNLHAFGNLLAFMLVTVHFVVRVLVPPLAAGTGLALYVVTCLMVLTGIPQRFRLAGRATRAVRYVHVSMALGFYVVLGVHIWHDLLVLGVI